MSLRRELAGPIVRGTITSLVATLVLSGLMVAQTTGVAGVNDFTINGAGTGGTSPVASPVLSENTNTLQLRGQPGQPVLLASAANANPGALPIDGTSSVDLDLATFTPVLDGSGVLMPSGPLAPLLVADGAGDWSMAISSGVLPGNVLLGALQMGQVDAVTGAITLSQAHLIFAQETNCTDQANTWTSPPDDGDLQVVLDSTFTFYGVSYTSVYISSNGSLAFGSGVGFDFSDSGAEFLSGAPRVAVWEDYSPNVAGKITYGEEYGIFTATWRDVPTWAGGLPSDANTFCMSLDTLSGEVMIFTEAMGLLLGNNGRPVVGITPGGSLSGTSASVDISNQIGDGSDLSVGASDAVFEDFNPQPGFDLQWSRFAFFPSGGFGVGPYLVY
ncbi:MAG: hypothetical protein CMJ83_04865 [Planctomycetes bacterium]|nr:hypothetical protein [Planctomycetota bacterium]